MSLQLMILVAKVLTAVLSVGVLLTELTMHLIGRRRDYGFGDTVANFCTAVVYAALGGLALACILPVYEAIRTHFALFDIQPASAWAWILGLACADFCHYWFHRAAHRNNFMWGIHQGHHSSEEFNLSVAARKGIFQQWVDWPFFLPMALLGFPFFTMYLPLKAAQFAYQFWVHNQFIGKLGWIEKILVTPSLHRVHHGQNVPYVDKNYAGVLILWDRLFGSYAEEREAVIYGISTPVRTFNPLAMQFTYWINLWRDACASSNAWDRLRIWFMPTGWRPACRRQALWPNKIEDCRSFEKYQCRIAGRTKAYVLTQVVIIAVLTSRIVGGTDLGVTVSNAVALLFVLWSAWGIGLLLDQQLHARRYELLRLALMIVWAVAAPNTLPGGVLTMLLPALVSIAMLGFLRSEARSQAPTLATGGPVANR